MEASAKDVVVVVLQDEVCQVNVLHALNLMLYANCLKAGKHTNLSFEKKKF